MADKGTKAFYLKWTDGQRGYTESPPGSNLTKYGKAYGMDGVAWCAMFQWYGLVQVSGLNHIKSAYTPTVANWYAGQKRGFTDDEQAEPGDLVFFNFGMGRIHHIGVLVKHDRANNVLITDEGNTSSSNAGSQDNGGGVFRRERSYSHAVYFGRPYYKEAREPRFNFPKDSVVLKLGSKGADVVTLERQLNRFSNHLAKFHDKATDFDPFKLDEEPDFKRSTKKAVQTFQHWRNQREKKNVLDVDGIAGSVTTRQLEETLARFKAHKH